jgi:c-di-GMP-binding flagellar brake protein YcgR
MTLERRRYKRVDAPEGQIVRVELRHRVQLMDISLSGALLACETSVPVGVRGRLRAGLASEAFTADLQVRRLHPRSATAHRNGLGALFLSMDDTSRRSLEQFLRRASEQA